MIDPHTSVIARGPFVTGSGRPRTVGQLRGHVALAERVFLESERWAAGSVRSAAPHVGLAGVVIRWLERFTIPGCCLSALHER
jgi:hypothetical protein